MSTSRTCCLTSSVSAPRKRKLKVNEAFEYLIQEEEQRLIDMDQVTRIAIDRVEDFRHRSFSTRSTRSPAVRAAMALTFPVKGCSATSCPSSKAPPSTAAMAWCAPTIFCLLAAGAFHVSKPSDLIPELQGRFPKFAWSCSRLPCRTLSAF